MTEEDFKARTAELLIEEDDAPETWWWLSFADDVLGFLGVAIVKAHGIVGAGLKAHRLGINPGGQVMGIPLPEGAPAPPAEATNKLLTKAEAELYFGAVKSIRELEEESKR